MSQERNKTVARIEAELTKSPDLNSLNLTPAYDKDNGDLGLSQADIQATSRVLARLLRQSDLSAIAPIMIGEVKPVLELQLGHAIKRKETEQKLTEKNQVRDKGRRRFFKTSLILIAAVSLGVPVLKNLGDTITKVAGEVEAREKAQKEQFEKNNVLGLTASAPSSAGWRVRYPAKDNNVSYIKSDAKDSLAIIDNGDPVKFSTGNFLDSGNTRIYLSDYQKLDGNSIPTLKIFMGNSSSSPSESWVLRDQPNIEIGTEVLVFENVKTDEVRYLSIVKTKAQSPAFQVQLMEKVTR